MLLLVVGDSFQVIREMFLFAVAVPPCIVEPCIELEEEEVFEMAAVVCGRRVEAKGGDRR